MRAFNFSRCFIRRNSWRRSPSRWSHRFFHDMILSNCRWSFGAAAACWAGCGASRLMPAHDLALGHLFRDFLFTQHTSLLKHAADETVTFLVCRARYKQAGPPYFSPVFDLPFDLFRTAYWTGVGRSTCRPLYSSQIRVTRRFFTCRWVLFSRKL